MIRSPESFDRLIAELEFDRAQLAELLAKNRRAHERILAGSVDELDLFALGYTIHNIYGAMEGSCYRVAKHFENNLPADSWHRELLNRMLIDIPKLRPAFLDKKTFALIDELRGFRHIFRNSYGRALDRDRVLLLQTKIPAAAAAFEGAIHLFIAFLRELRDRIKG